MFFADGGTRGSGRGVLRGGCSGPGDEAFPKRVRNDELFMVSFACCCIRALRRVLDVKRVFVWVGVGQDGLESLPRAFQ